MILMAEINFASKCYNYLFNNNNKFVKRLLFADEAKFSLYGYVNRQNCRYWTTNNPQWFSQFHSQHTQIVWLFFRANPHWCKISGFAPEWPYPYPDNFISRSKRNRFASKWYHRLKSVVISFNKRAPSHCATRIRACLDKVFPSWWISRKVMVELQQIVNGAQFAH